MYHVDTQDMVLQIKEDDNRKLKCRSEELYDQLSQRIVLIDKLDSSFTKSK